MFTLKLATCALGILCTTDEPAFEYPSVERCHQQGAIIAGMARADQGIYAAGLTWKATCTNTSDQSISIAEGAFESLTVRVIGD